MTPDSAKTSVASSLGPDSSVAPCRATIEGAADADDDAGVARVGVGEARRTAKTQAVAFTTLLELNGLEAHACSNPAHARAIHVDATYLTARRLTELLTLNATAPHPGAAALRKRQGRRPCWHARAPAPDPAPQPQVGRNNRHHRGTAGTKSSGNPAPRPIKVLGASLWRHAGVATWRWAARRRATAARRSLKDGLGGGCTRVHN